MPILTDTAKSGNVTSLTGKPKLLDLCCGTGGCSAGYAEAGFEVEGVDHKPQPNYPYTFHLADALTFPLEGYDAYHASVPCQGYTELNAAGKERHPRLIPAMRKRLLETGKPFVLENVTGAVSDLLGSITLCGSMFGLKVQRHRLFESNILMFVLGPCRHKHGCISVHGHSIWDSSQKGTVRRDGRVRPGIVSFETGCRAMTIDWMTHEELVQAIPPAFTFYIASRFLLDAVQANQEVPA